MRRPEKQTKQEIKFLNKNNEGFSVDDIKARNFEENEKFITVNHRGITTSSINLWIMYKKEKWEKKAYKFASFYRTDGSFKWMKIGETSDKIKEQIKAEIIEHNLLN